MPESTAFDRDEPSPKGVALSLESSFLGFYAHAGFWSALRARGVQPEFVAGASSGALLACFIGAGFTDEEIREVIFSPEFRFSFWELGVPWRLFRLAFVLKGGLGITRFRRTREVLSRVFATRLPRLENAVAARITIAVADLTAMRSRILDSGDTVDAILASCALPVLVEPQLAGGHHCWDGGVANSLPIMHLAANPAVEHILAHTIQHQSQVAKPQKGAVDPRQVRIGHFLGNCHQLITNEIQDLQMQVLQQYDVAFTKVVTPTERPGLFSRRTALERLYAAGVASGQACQLPCPRLPT
jgi:predicted acylesterase/phospholipase RssA